MTTMNLPTVITLLFLSTANLVAGQNVTFTNTTTTVITTVITTSTNNTSNATMTPAPPPNATTTSTTSATTPITISSRMTTLPSVTTWGPLMYCWFPCYGGACGGGYPVPQIPYSGGSLSWWFGFQFQWSKSKPRQQSSPCPKKGGRRRKGC
ncbi:beclin-1-like protein B isoform X2 [Zootermopsis nevadensis]|uniref:Uncharacterized protein n=1 Tax=Zootermopsis nevadensis TaxID=136037 RepID=A0A067QQZ4_ZOONE|nr:beclin-1-like protein B isoform X1 [Zootermopsis nevadensis]XP_021940809.1 beclin-1-like protein B isoform X2 [Zootermopsis nevadensis]KDR07315.1 hypothetical protein L798_03096 [Zootermopsis nevadensis]